MKQHHSIATPEQMHELGKDIGGLLTKGDVVVLVGPLGAGKTTLTRGIAEELNVRGPITSPTFVLARTHPNLGEGPPLVHVDAYRLHSAMELDDLDIDYPHSIVVMEWGKGLVEELTESWLEVTIDRPTGSSDADFSEESIEPREVTIVGHGPRWKELS